MGREAIVSSGDMLRRISLEQGEERQCVPLERAGALCVSKENIYCACGDAIWQLDAKYLRPTGLFGGGPGMCRLLLSQDGMRLFALCAEADSVLMLSAERGEAMLVNRAGVNPKEMALEGETLAIAGGESGLVILLCARSLQVMDALEMPGPVYSVAIRQDTVHALCLTAELSSLLVTQQKCGTRSMLALSGMPGSLLVRQDDVLAATDGAVYVVTRDGGKVLRRICFPGRAMWMADSGGETLMLDGYTEKLFAAGRHGIRLLDRRAAFAALCGV